MRVFARTRLVSVFVCILALLLVAMPVQADGNPNPGIAPAGSNAYGKSYNQWAADWWNWALSGPDGNNVLQDTTGALCGLNQSGPVWYLAGTSSSGAAERTCTVPTGKALFFPVANAFNADDPGDPVLTYEDVLNQLDELFWSPLESASATIDGRDVRALPNYLAVSPEFDLVLPPQNIYGAPAGTYTPAVAKGYYLMVLPLPPGHHEIHFRAVFKNANTGGDDVIDVTYHLTVSS
jgi:hypothetical protein